MFWRQIFFKWPIFLCSRLNCSLKHILLVVLLSWQHKWTNKDLLHTVCKVHDLSYNWAHICGNMRVASLHYKVQGFYLPTTAHSQLLSVHKTSVELLYLVSLLSDACYLPILYTETTVQIHCLLGHKHLH